MAKLSKAQQFAIDYALNQEFNRDVEVFGEDDMHRYQTTATLGGKRTVAVLEREGLMTPFESTERKIRERRGSGVINTASVSSIPVTRWKLTEKGRQLAKVNTHHLNDVGREAYARHLAATEE